VSRRAVHLLTPEERNKVPQFTDVWVDVGFDDAKEAREVVRPGDPVTFALGYRPMRNNKAASVAMDDKVGVWVAMEALRLLHGKPLSVPVYCVSTVQEEIGLRGATIDPNGTAIFGTPDTETSFRSDFYAALGGRLGVAAGPALIYVKGGGALLRARASTIDPCVAPPAGCGTGTLTMQGSETMLGWLIGGGAEWALDPRWTVKAEYAFFDFGSIDTAGTSNVLGEFYRQSIDVTVHTVRLGLNYRFAAPAASVVKR
jgi:opacity protein-like surface antigen